MAAVANQVHSTAQQIGARIGWNPIDAATQPPTGTRERVLNLSDPRTDHRKSPSLVTSIYYIDLYIDPAGWEVKIPSLPHKPREGWGTLEFFTHIQVLHIVHRGVFGRRMGVRPCAIPAPNRAEDACRYKKVAI
jgi:hypothetical protein